MSTNLIGNSKEPPKVAVFSVLEEFRAQLSLLLHKDNTVVKKFNVELKLVFMVRVWKKHTSSRVRKY